MRRIVLVVLSAIVLWTLSVWMRRQVFHQQTQTVGPEAPFLLESALQFRMTRMVGEGGGLPRIDESVQYPDGVEIRKTYTIGAEYVYSAIARLLPRGWSFATRVRWASVGLFSLTIPLAALWCGLRYRSMLAGWACGLILAVSPAFVVRSSGLELSRENLAFPLMAAFLVFREASRTSSTGSRRWVYAVLAGSTLALAQVFWDMSQYLIGLWVVGEWVLVRVGARGLTAESSATLPDSLQTSWAKFRASPGHVLRAPAAALPVSVAVALLLATWINPYMRSQGFLFSPVMTLVLARAGYVCLSLGGLGHRQRWLAVGVFFVLWQALGGLFATNYGHFGELLWAKIRFLNVKPENPSRLTYIQRIMWTPALNSSTWELTTAYFPITLLALLVALCVLPRASCRAAGADMTDVFYAVVTFPFYILFFRFHVFLILFAAGCVGGALSLLFPHARPRVGMAARLALLALLFGVEFYHLLFFEPAEARKLRAEHERRRQALRALGIDSPPFVGNRWGRPGATYGQINQLIEELRLLEEPGPVLAGFGISGSILGYADLPIILHPKFENPVIRERVRQFYEGLFLRSEKEFRDWAVSFLPEGDRAPRAYYYVHGLGSLAGGDTREAPRYMVDALHPPPDAAVHVLENRPRDAVWFRPVGGNEKFRIFRIITPADERMADDLAAQAERAWARGDVETARRRAFQALQYHWKHPAAQALLARPF